ncbi:hypothetical protein QQS21_004596 [Conoideocrella luteorostrata]|uniref:Uncharacterized protein n=1 Tax=Conoideocrella luteorostrata TaxID=1105319 RepID=A0AAJ0FUH7_9HYPO|nr:hypothetical protein QQS21_004596 [Conoideocrella luteorostrata]
MIAFNGGDDDLDATQLLLNTIIEKHRLVMPYENFAILLKYNAQDIGDCVRLAMSGEEDPHDGRYTHYQRLLQTELLNQEARSVYQHIIQVSEADSRVGRRLGKSIYTLPDMEQAIYLLHELESFVRAHYWLHVITIESLHRATVTKLLKSWLGEKFQVVYIDVDYSKRLRRSLVTQDQLKSNDQLKKERGVETIAAEADLVLDNNGTVAQYNR